MEKSKLLLSKLNRGQGIYTLAIVSVAGILFALSFNTFQTGAYADDAHYLVLGKALATGNGYRLISFPHAPVHTTFPCGYPTLLSFIFRLGADFGPAAALAKLLNIGFILASALISWLLFKGACESSLRWAVLLFLFNPQAVGLSSQVMSEPAYMFVSLLSLYLFDCYATEKVKKPFIFIILASIFAGIATMVRTIGFSIVLAFIIYLILLRRWKYVPFLGGIFLLSYMPQLLLNLRGGGGTGLVSSGYMEQTIGTGSLLTKGMQILSNLWAYATTGLAGILVPLVGPRVMSAMGPLRFLGAAFGLVVTGILVVGWVNTRGTVDLRRIYLITYLVGALYFWNPETGNTKLRFLIPLLPFLYVFLVRGITRLVTVVLKWARIDARRVVPIQGSVFLIILVLLLARDLQGILNPVRTRIADLSAGADWFQGKVPEEAIIMTRDPVSRYLYFQHSTVDYPRGESSVDAVSYVCENSVNYVFVGPSLRGPSPTDLDQTTLRFITTIEREPAYFLPVHQDLERNISLYKVQNCPSTEVSSGSFIGR